MRIIRPIFLATLVGLVIGPPSDGPVLGQPAPAQTVPVITPEEYITSRLKGDNALLIDVRPVKEEFTAGHIPGATHISVNDLDKTTFNLPPNQKLVVTCGCCKWAVCPNVLPAAQKLISRGFIQVSALRLEDGIPSWTATSLEKGEGLPPPVIQPVGAGGPATPGAIPEYKLSLIVPDPLPFPQDIANFTEALKKSLPKLNVTQISHRTGVGRRLVKSLRLQALPAALFDSSFEKAAVFSSWSQAGWVGRSPDGKGFLISPNAFPPQVYLDRDRIPHRLDIFVMSQCPFGISALQQILQASLDKKLPNIQITPHYIINKIQGSSSSSSNDPSAHFQSLHGVSELEEDIRQLIILKYNPDKFAAYFLERSKQPTSSLWDKVAASVGLDPAFISKKYGEEGMALAEEEEKLGSQLNISTSPTFLWENTIRINGVDKFKSIPALKDLDIKLVGSCNKRPQ